MHLINSSRYVGMKSVCGHTNTLLTVVPYCTTSVRPTFMSKHVLQEDCSDAHQILPEYQLLHTSDMSLSHRKKLKNLFRKGKHDDRSTVEGAGPHSDEDMQGEGQPEAPMAIKVRTVLVALPEMELSCKLSQSVH